MAHFVVMTSDQLATAQALDDDENCAVGTRPMDADDPGTGTNDNPDADGVALDEIVTLSGKYVCPVRMITDPDTLVYCPDLPAYLTSLPWCELDPDVIFAPFARG